jgi:hypothetical protein
MTTNHPTARWRQIAATSAVFIAAVSVATATANTADARVKGGIEDFNQCIIDQTKWVLAHNQVPDMDALKSGCCWAIGGQVVTNADGTFQDCIFDITNEPGQTRNPVQPPPSAVMPPPGSNQIN